MSQEKKLPPAFGYLCDWGGVDRQAVYYGKPGSALEDDWNEHPKVHRNLPIYTADQMRERDAMWQAKLDAALATTNDDEPIGWFSLEAMRNIKWREGLAVCDFEEGQPFFERPNPPAQRAAQARDAALEEAALDALAFSHRRNDIAATIAQSIRALKQSTPAGGQHD